MTMKIRNRHSILRLLQVRAVLVAAVCAVLTLGSCSKEGGDWNQVAATIPDNVHAVVCVSSAVIDKLGEEPMSGEAIDFAEAMPLRRQSAKMLYVADGESGFFTWPLSDVAATDELIADWQEVQIGNDKDDARALKTGNSVVIANSRQAWLFPSVSDVKTAVSRLSQSINDSRRGTDDEEKYGLLGNPTAMSVVLAEPDAEKALAYFSLDENPMTATLSVASYGDPRGYEYTVIVKRHKSDGEPTVLCDEIADCDSTELKQALREGNADIYGLSAAASFGTGALGKYLPGLVSPYLTIAQRVALNALVSPLKKASGMVFASGNPQGESGFFTAIIGFASAADAEEAKGKIMTLAEGRVNGLNCEVRDKSLHLSLRAPWPAFLSSPGRKGYLSGMSLRAGREKATLRFYSPLSPAQIVDLIASKAGQ